MSRVALRRAGWETARSASGPAVIAWLERTGEYERLPTRRKANLSPWRRGARASFFTLDALLAEIQLHPSQLPDEVWERKAA